jgi:hypothetical protein
MSDPFHVRYLFVVIASSKFDSFMFDINTLLLDATQTIHDMMMLVPNTLCSAIIKTLSRLSPL